MKRASGLQRLLNASRYSCLGLKAAWRGQASFRQEVAALAVLVPCAFFLGTNATQRALLLLSLLLIPLAELVNSAIEAIVDRIGLEEHPLAGQAKDIGSAAVLVALVAAAVVWALVAGERFGA